MTKNKIAALIASAALAAFAAACNPDTTTTTTTNTNSATVTNNANTTAMNTNTGMMNTNAGSSTTTTTTTRTYNANMTREDYDRDKDRYAEDAKKAGNNIGSGLEDGWLWTKTHAALTTADDLRDSTINVDVNNNVVTLRGTVANQGQKTKAVQIAKGIKDVKSVRDELRVSPNDSMTNTNKSANR